MRTVRFDQPRRNFPEHYDVVRSERVKILRYCPPSCEISTEILDVRRARAEDWYKLRRQMGETLDEKP